MLSFADDQLSHPTVIDIQCQEDKKRAKEKWKTNTELVGEWGMRKLFRANISFTDNTTCNTLYLSTH